MGVPQRVHREVARIAQSVRITQAWPPLRHKRARTGPLLNQVGRGSRDHHIALAVKGNSCRPSHQLAAPLPDVDVGRGCTCQCQVGEDPDRQQRHEGGDSRDVPSAENNQATNTSTEHNQTPHHIYPVELVVSYGARADWATPLSLSLSPRRGERGNPGEGSS